MDLSHHIVKPNIAVLVRVPWRDVKVLPVLIVTGSEGRATQGMKATGEVSGG